MAIGRVSGLMLKSNLERQGIDLSFETDLLYLDVTNNRIGVRNNAPTKTLDITGDAAISGTVTVTTEIRSGNLSLSSNTFSSTNVNGNILVRPDGTGKVIIGTATDAGDYMLQVEGNIRATGNIVANGNITLGDANTDSITVNADFATGLTPDLDDTYSLGSTTKRWQGVFSTIYGGSNQNIVLSPAGTGKVSIADNTKLSIGGGTSGYVLTTDGNGVLSWSSVSALSSAVVGNTVTLGAPTDSNLTSPGATNAWTTSTTVTDAIDDLNEMMLNVAKGTFVGNVDFTATTLDGPSPVATTFTATYSGTPTTYLWNFGDGTTASTGPTVSKTYTQSAGGQFTVSVTVSNSGGSGTGSTGTKSRTNYITLYTPNPTASFTLNKTAVDTGGAVLLTNTSTNADSYVIYWGDGTTDTVSSNSVAGGVGGGTLSHTYAVTGTADTRYQPYIIATSSTAAAAPAVVSVTSSTQNVYVYKTHSPSYTYTTLTGNNDYSLTPDGWNVTFTNTTAAGVGATATFSGNKYRWDWGDSTVTDVNSGSGSAGDRSVAITHKFSLTDPAVQQTFTVTLKVYNGHASSPFSSTTQTVTVNPDPQAVFTAAAVTASDRTGDSTRTGYYFTDLAGVNRAIMRFTNSSLNTSSYKWTWGDTTDSGTLAEGVAGTPTGGTLDHTYTATGSYNVALLATGTYSESATDDTNTQTGYISILAAPAAPAGLSSKTLSMSTASVGTSPYLAALATDNSGTTPSAGVAVTRYVSGTVVTNTVADVYNAYTGTLSAEFNGAADGSRAMTSGDDAGTYTNLVISQDRDAHAAAPSTYPTNFYKVFSAYHTKALSGVSVGYNDVRLTHSATGNTNKVAFVKDDVTVVPTVDLTTATLATGTAGTLRYISGVPYFNTGSPTVTLTGASLYDWIGQTYQNTTTPFQIEPSGTNAESTTGNVVASQTKTYANLDGATTFLSSSIPKADTGKNSGSPYAIGVQTINVAPASTAAAQTIKFRATNVNGNGSYATHSKNIQVFTATPSGFVEDNISCSSSLGATYTDAAKRILITGASGANPAYNSATNYYTSSLFSGAVTVAGTDESIVRWNQLKHFATDLSGYLPVGPNLATGRSGTQYFRGAFRRTNVASFYVTITGKISGFKIAAPGTAIDSTSSTNGWLDATVQYAGAGVPGANTGAGGNGSNGCALTGADRISTGSVISGTTYRLTLGSENLSNATGGQLLFSIALASGDYITSLSFS